MLVADTIVIEPNHSSEAVESDLRRILPRIDGKPGSSLEIALTTSPVIDPSRSCSRPPCSVYHVRPMVYVQSQRSVH